MKTEMTIPSKSALAGTPESHKSKAVFSPDQSEIGRQAIFSNRHYEQPKEKNMKRTAGRLLITLTVLALGITNIKAEGNILVNGDFETGDLSGWNVFGGAGDGSIRLTGDNVESGSYAITVGFQSFANTPPELAFGYPHLPTIAGQAYLLTFWCESPYGGGHPAYGNTIQLNAQWNGDPLFSLVDHGYYNGIPSIYTEYSASVTGTGDDNLIFYAQGAGSPGFVYLDNVSLVSAPEPTSLALLALGGVVLFSYCFARRKFKQLPLIRPKRYVAIVDVPGITVPTAKINSASASVLVRLTSRNPSIQCPVCFPNSAILAESLAGADEGASNRQAN